MASANNLRRQSRGGAPGALGCGIGVVVPAAWVKLISLLAVRISFPGITPCPWPERVLSLQNPVARDPVKVCGIYGSMAVGMGRSAGLGTGGHTPEWRLGALRDLAILTSLCKWPNWRARGSVGL